MSVEFDVEPFIDGWVPVVPRSVAEINAEYWQKELDKLQPVLRYSMHVQRELSKARCEIEAAFPSVPSSEGEQK